MEMNCAINSLFLFWSFMYGINSSSYALNYAYYGRVSNSDSAIRPQHIQSLITHGITNKAAYLSKAAE